MPGGPLWGTQARRSCASTTRAVVLPGVGCAGIQGGPGQLVQVTQLVAGGQQALRPGVQLPGVAACAPVASGPVEQVHDLHCLGGGGVPLQGQGCLAACLPHVGAPGRQAFVGLNADAVAQVAFAALGGRFAVGGKGQHLLARGRHAELRRPQQGAGASHWPRPP